MKPTYEQLEQQVLEQAVQLANAESKCRELAVENAALKDGVNKAVEDIQCFYDSDGWHVSEDGESETAVVALDDAKGSIEHFALSVKTPATDAFLAEVRAQGVTEYASKRGFSFQHGSIHAHFGNGDVMVGSVTFENGDAGINFAPVREKTGGVGTHYDWTKGKTAEQVDSIFVIASSNAEGLEVIRDKLSEAIAQLRKGAAL